MSAPRPTGDDRGAVTALELVLVAPLLLALLAFAVFCGRMGRTAHVVRALAASAARAASVERSAPAAEAAAARIIGSPGSGDLECRAPAVSFGSDGTVDTVTVRVELRSRAVRTGPPADRWDAHVHLCRHRADRSVSR